MLLLGTIVGDALSGTSANAGRGLGSILCLIFFLHVALLDAAPSSCSHLLFKGHVSIYRRICEFSSCHPLCEVCAAGLSAVSSILPHPEHQTLPFFLASDVDRY